MESRGSKTASPVSNIHTRWDFIAKTKVVCHAARLGSFIKDMVGQTPRPSQTIWLDATLSQRKKQNKIRIQVWTPADASATAKAAVIDFHGGGWILGRGKDDARWVDTLVKSLDVIVFTVDYSLAPKHPFPSPLEDCVDAICHIANRASEFGFDANKIMLSGFSAGASNCLGAWVILQDPSRWGYTIRPPPTHAMGLILFYPLLDWTVSRAEKRRTSTRPDLTLSEKLTNLIDAAYVYPSMPEEDRSDPRLSPGLMPDEMLQNLPPMHLCLCEHDMLLAEGLRLATRLRSQKKQFTLRTVKGAKHGWDKAVRLFLQESVLIEYREAVGAMRAWMSQSNDYDEHSI